MHLTLDFLNQYGVSKIVDENLKNYPIMLKNYTQKFCWVVDYEFDLSFS